MAIQYPQKCSSVLTPWDSINTLNNLILIGKSNTKAVKLVINPLGALGAIFLKELIEKSTMKEGLKTPKDLIKN
jgi:hypothetical protein